MMIVPMMVMMLTNFWVRWRVAVINVPPDPESPYNKHSNGCVAQALQITSVVAERYHTTRTKQASKVKFTLASRLELT